MDGLLTEVKTATHGQQSSLTSATETSRRLDVGTHEIGHAAEPGTDPTSSEYILATLRAKPDQIDLSVILATLDPSNPRSTPKDFDIRLPSPTTAQILNVLVSTTIPDHWEALNGASKGSRSRDTKLRAGLLRCLSSVAGISGLVTSLRSLLAAFRSSSQRAGGSASQVQIRIMLSVLSALFEPKDLVMRFYTDIETLYDSSTRKQVVWRELLSLVAAGRVLSIAAEALTLIGDSADLKKISWVGTGSRYASWLGINICHMASKTDIASEDAWKAMASLAGRALSLGYTDNVVDEIYSGLLIEQDLPAQYGSLFDYLRTTEQTAVLEATFRCIERKYLPDRLSSDEHDSTPSELVGDIAALCSVLIHDRARLQAQLTEWLSKGQGGSIRTVGLRRALLANMMDKPESLQTLLIKSLEQSGDKFYIKQAPMMNQEANTQVILLAAGHLQRVEPLMVMAAGRSGAFLNAVSNRLAASSTRARFLGMIVGTAISKLIEPAGKGMRFYLEEMESEEAAWYLSLPETVDSIGSVESLRSTKHASKSQPKPIEKLSSTSTPKPGRDSDSGRTKIISIEEIESDGGDEDEDDDLLPYEKPDEDPSDSDEDPTLVQRNKPTAPVYIRDLITYLRDTENVERHNLAVTTAPSLIRRKINFGTELAENTEELALVLVGLQEQSKNTYFHERRLQSMIALIVSQPLKMGRWFSAILFDGDLSQVQRSAVLTALGLAVRELAGNGEQDARMMGLPSLPDTSFPSKKLPPGVEAWYGDDRSPIDSLTQKISQTSLQPLAAHAADAMSGPNALKVRTFSSKMEVDKRRQQREEQRQKATIKDLYKVLAEGFFYPLKGRFEIMLVQFSSTTAPTYNPFFTPHILTLYLQTLTLTLSTMGPHTPYLHALTHDTLSLLLSLHTRPIVDDPSILTALLALFLAITDLNVAAGSTGEERLVTEFATQVVELRDWAGQIFERMPAGDVGGDEARDRLRTLAAGVMVRLGEVMERYQGRLMGVGSGFRY